MNNGKQITKKEHEKHSIADHIMDCAGMDEPSTAHNRKKKEDEQFICKKNNKSHSDEIAWKSASSVMANVSVGLLFGRRKFFFRLR